MELYCWGRGEDGQLGLGDKQDIYSPTRVAELQDCNVADIACGSGHTVILTKDGQLFSWGRGDDGRLGHKDSRWRYKPYGISSLANVVIKEVTCGSYHTAAVTVNGGLYTWGGGMYGKLGHGTETGCTEPKEVNLSGVIQVACGSRHTIALVETRSGNRVFAWGDKTSGVLIYGATQNRSTPAAVLELDNKDVVQISACGFHSGAVSSTGKVYTWGESKFGRLGRPCDNDKYVPVQISDTSISDKMIIQVSCGGFHTAAITDDGKLYTWGGGEHGQLGHSNKYNFVYPNKVEALESDFVSQVTCGWSHTVALTKEGKVYTWGNGDHGKLGHENKKRKTVPKLVEGLAGKFVHRIASYNEHTCALVKPSGSNTRSDLDSAFVADMSSMVNNKDSFSDVCFIVQGEKVYAHRAILAARSEHFSAMFNSGMKESTEKEIELPSKMKLEVFLALLKYLYTDSINGVSLDVALALSSAADFYQLRRLKELCDEMIRENLNDGNAPLLLQIAHDDHNLHMRELCLKYVLANFETVSRTDNFAILERPLILEILKMR